MKHRIIVPTIVLALISFVSNAQTATTKNNRTVVTKGYYSIGNNFQKLASPIRTIPLFKQRVPQKGYYSIEPNERKLPAPQGINLSERKITPVRKGYYSIGNNYEKLK